MRKGSLTEGEEAMSLPTRLAHLRQPVLELAARHGASNVRVFGSVARGDHRADSDVDLLVDLEPGVTFLGLNRLRRELSELLGVPVDVVSSAALLPRDDDVRRDAVAL